eukprot:scaffold10057_cov24-Phaeocystis_antarctica.AAC.1
MIPLRRPSRRFLHNNDLSGSLPSQLGLFTALRVGGGRARRAAAHRGSAHIALATLCVRRRSPHDLPRGALLAGGLTTTS